MKSPGGRVQSLSAADPHEIGPYRVVGRLGAGGMGMVYAGVDRAGRRVAIKLVHEALSTDLEFRRRFSREISVLTEVDGACVARVLGSDSGTERPWLATEFIAGPTLEQHVRAEGPLTGDALYGLAAGLAEALVAMHAVDVVHRDLKPSNVILSPRGPRLIDFGIAKVLDDTAMTHTGMLIGSPGWISPEEYGDDPVGTPVDVYGWALLVLFAATGEPPYGAGRPEVLAYRVREETPDLTGVPEGLSALVGRALDKDPDSRPAADDVLAAVTRTWRAKEKEQVAPDITSLIQRTWVMPKHEMSDWPEPPTPALSTLPPAVPPTLLASAVPATGPAALRSGRPVADPTKPASGVDPAVPQGAGTLLASGMPQLPSIGQAVKHGPSWLHAYVVTAVAVTLIAVTAIIANSSSGRSTMAAASLPTIPTSAPSAAALPSIPASTATASSPAPTKTAVRKPLFKGKVVSFKGHHRDNAQGVADEQGR
ncbi:protein kinase [Sphaerisporangium sp. NPDC088356]|uniref:serine/threonine-protein kinase n=1 Tax=Sphaerisporangium sp. NPDC088356 TaxID=3154871 RepID=UPI003412233E